MHALPLCARATTAARGGVQPSLSQRLALFQKPEPTPAHDPPGASRFKDWLARRTGREWHARLTRPQPSRPVVRGPGGVAAAGGGGRGLRPTFVALPENPHPPVNRTARHAL